MGGGTSSQIVNSAINVGIANLQFFKSNVTAIQQKTAAALIKAASDTNMFTQNVFDFDASKLDALGDVNINLTINQTTKVVNMANIDARLVSSVTSELASNLVDTLISSLDNNSLASLMSSNAQSSKSSLLDALAGILRNNQQRLSINEIVNSSIVNQYVIERNAFVQSIVNTTDTAEIASNIRMSGLNFIYAKINSITTTGNISIKVNADQLADLEAVLNQNVAILSNVISKMEDSKQFLFSSEVKSTASAVLQTKQVQKTESEQVSDLGNIVGNMFKPFMYPILIGVGVLFLLIILLRR